MIYGSGFGLEGKLAERRRKKPANPGEWVYRSSEFRDACGLSAAAQDETEGRQGDEAQNRLSDEQKKLTEAYSCTVLWTQACQKQESKTQEVEAEASNLRQQNQALQDSVKDLSESVKKIETELAQEKIQTQAVQETQKYWSERHLETDSERQMAIDQREE